MRALQDLAVFQDVGDAGGTAHVVFEDVEGAVLIADEVGSGDVGPDATGRGKPFQLGAVGFGRFDEFGGDHLVLEDFAPPMAVVVDVGEEMVEGEGALLQALLEVLPVFVFDDAGENVEGEYFFGAGFVAIDGEGDAHLEEGGFGGLLAAEQFGVRHLGDAFGEGDSAGAGLARGLEELIEEAVGLVGGKIHGDSLGRVVGGGRSGRRR
jgi:hypothetical protein